MKIFRYFINIEFAYAKDVLYRRE